MGKLATLLFVAVAMSLMATRAECSQSAARTAALADTFAFRYVRDWGTEIDTRRRLLTKDLITQPDTTVSFEIAPADLDSIYHKMMEIHFFDMPEPHPAWPKNCPTHSQPETAIHLEAILGSTTRRLSWSSTASFCGRWSPGPWQGLRELEALIWRVMVRQPEYASLPPAQGGYR